MKRPLQIGDRVRVCKVFMDCYPQSQNRLVNKTGKVVHIEGMVVTILWDGNQKSDCWYFDNLAPVESPS